MQGTLLDKRYRINRQLGKGGFGETYLAEDIRRMERPCVVKRFQPASTDPNTLREAKLLFDSEARTLEKLGREHDQIPDLLDYFEEDQQFYLVQELVEGQPLNVILAAGPLPESDVIELLGDVLDVLSYVHRCQVIHRDIKPSNLIRRQKDGRIVLIDFGAVKQVQTQVINTQGQTEFSRVIGTSGYMPNEQAGGKPRFNSDLYALGMTAIEALTGVPPYQLPEDPRTGEVLWQGRVPVKAELAAILSKMVQPHFRDRYQSTDEALTDLQALRQLGNQKTEKNKTEKTKKSKAEETDLVIEIEPKKPSKRRTKLLIGGAAVLVLALVGWGGHTGMQYLGSRNAETYYTQGLTQADQGNKRAAIDSFTQVIRLNPNHTDAYYRRGNAYSDLGEYQTALEDYNQAIRLDPNNTNAFNNRGIAHAKLGNPQAAIQDYTEAIRLNPNNPDAYYNRGISQPDASKKIQDYTKAIELNSKYTNAYYNRGIAYADQGNRAAAIEDYNQALQLDPNFANAYYNRGLAHANLGNLQAALDDYNQVIRLNPKDADAFYRRGNVNSDLDKLQAAIEDYTEAIALNPKYADAYNNRGNVRSRLDNAQAALEDFNQALRLKPDYALAYYNRGVVRSELGNKQGALEDYNQAIRLDPTYANAHYNRGVIYSDLGNKRVAIDNYTQAIQLDPNYANAYYNRANANSVLGDKAAAIKDYKKAAELYQTQGKTKDYQDALTQIRKLQPQQSN